MRWAWVLTAFLTARWAWAHDADVVFVWPEAAGVELEESMTLTEGTVLRLAPIDGDSDGLLTQAELDSGRVAVEAGIWAQAPVRADGQPCSLSRTQAVVRSGFIELLAHFTCPAGEWRQDFRFLSVLPPNYRVVLGKAGQSQAGRPAAQGSFSVLTLPRSAATRFDAGLVAAGAEWGLREAMSPLWAGLVLLACSLKARRLKVLLLAGGVALAIGAGLGAWAATGDRLALALGKGLGATVALAVLAGVGVPLMSFVSRRWRWWWLVALALALCGIVR